MHVPRCFLYSLGLAVLAIGFQMTALSESGRAAGAIARAVSLPESERVRVKAQAHTHFFRAVVIGVVGLASALTSLVFVIVSARRRERAWRSVTIALLIVYLMLQFTLV